MGSPNSHPNPRLFFNGTSVRGQKALKCSLPKTQKCSCVVLRRGCGKRASLQEGKIARVGSSGLWSHGKGELAVCVVNIFSLSRSNLFCFLDSTADERYW